MGEVMASPTTPAELLDLKLMPAWVNEPAGAVDYSNYSGEEESGFGREGRRRPDRAGGERRGPRPQGRRDDRRGGDQRRPGGDRRQGDRRDRGERRDGPRGREREGGQQREERRDAPPLPNVAVRFIPHAAAFESVIAQIKSSTVTYSVFALARLFLAKPERYDVRLTSGEGVQLHQLGQDGPVAADSRILESSAFASLKDEYYTTETTQTEPIKGNFTNVARCRLSGTLLGPTNHHSYQPQLRSLYEQRFSRRMSFQDYQRQIEVVSDPAVVEQWKEQARSVTTFATKNIEPALTFNSIAEAERHFRQTHLPALLRSAQELTIGGVLSRRLPDRGLGRVIEDAWSAEMRSPSKMMAELAGGLRNAGLNIFRHRKGMLFVSPVRLRTFAHDRSTVSPTIGGILQALTDTPGLSRKQLAEKLTAGAEPADADRTKLSLASDLLWLAREGYVIEFNDGTLDLPRAKAPAPVESKPAAAPAAVVEEPAPAAEAEALAPADEVSMPQDEGGMTVEQSIEPAGEQTPAEEQL
jgi:hypothetical protein